MTKVTKLSPVTSWNRVLNAARRTVGKPPLDKEPSNSWKAKMLLAEHSPIRLLEYEWTWEQVPQWVTVHFVRHHIGCEKFVHTQRPDRTGSQIPRGEHMQGELNEMDMTANAQEIMAISRVRLCNCASKETKEAWVLMLNELEKNRSNSCKQMCSIMCLSWFCPELKCCGYAKTHQFKEAVEKYRKIE